MEEQNNIFMSAEIGEITAALSAFQGKVSQPKLNKEVSVKTKIGTSYKFKYADLGECIKSASPTLQEFGLAVTQVICNGNLITILSHKSGQWFKSVLDLKMDKINGYQELGSAITYLKRYSFCAILGIVADADDDGNLADGNTATFNDGQSQYPQNNAQSFTKEQLKQSLADLKACKTITEYQDVWKKYSIEVPALCRQGTEFFMACIRKNKELNQVG